MSLKYANGYIRVSTHDQEEISPDSQEHLLRDYAAKNNIVILKIFTDLGISGRKADKRRKLYNGMLRCQLYLYL